MAAAKWYTPLHRTTNHAFMYSTPPYRGPIWKGLSSNHDVSGAKMLTFGCANGFCTLWTRMDSQKIYFQKIVGAFLITNISFIQTYLIFQYNTDTFHTHLQAHSFTAIFPPSPEKPRLHGIAFGALAKLYTGKKINPPKTWLTGWQDLNMKRKMTFSSWWLNRPIWKILVKLDHFPK